MHQRRTRIRADFDASFLVKQGGRFKPTPGQPSPLSGAFLTVNPLLSPEEVQQSTVDPLLVKLNTQYDYSLFENPGKYTLVIATFNGKASNFITAEEDKSIFEEFTVGDSLDEAANESFAMAESMRKATKAIASATPTSDSRASTRSPRPEGSTAGARTRATGQGSPRKRQESGA